MGGEMDVFTRAVERTFGVEGGFSDHADDSGGATRYGITETTAREAGYTGAMDELPKDTARRILQTRYWEPIGGEFIAKFSPIVAVEVFDTAVLTGPERAVVFLQEELNNFNRRGRIYPDIAEDGIFGPQTTRALGSYIDARFQDDGERVLVAALNCRLGSFLSGLVGRRQKDESFYFGWIRTRVLRGFAGAGDGS